MSKYAIFGHFVTKYNIFGAILAFLATILGTIRAFFHEKKLFFLAPMGTLIAFIYYYFFHRPLFLLDSSNQYFDPLVASLFLTRLLLVGASG